MPKTFEFINKELIQRNIKVIFWDIDGVITYKDKTDIELLKDIINLGRKAVHVFITGRDRFWLIDNLISHINKISDISNQMDNFHFYPELGLMEIINTKTGDIHIPFDVENHILCRKDFRDRITKLFWSPEELKKADDKISEFGFYYIKDANNQGYRFPIIKDNELEIKRKPDHLILSNKKEIVITAEVFRDYKGRVNTELANKALGIGESLVDSYLRNMNVENDVVISVAGTALDITMKINGEAYNKSFAVGRVLLELESILKMNIYDIIDCSIIFGDGQADFDMCYPKIKDQKIEKTIPIAFVGKDHILDKIQNKDVLILKPIDFNHGPKVVKEVLTHLNI